MRQFGQTKLPLSFISNPSAVNQDPKSKPSKQSISLSEFLNRKLGKSSGRLLQEKQISIGSLGSAKKDFKGDPSEAASSSVPEGAIFQQFSRALKGKHGADLGDHAEVVKVGVDCFDNGKQYSMKRKIPSEFSSGDGARNQKYLVVLGDDPKPKRTRKERKPADNCGKTIYNHYASGQGWWDGDKEGIDSEEVGYGEEAWEGVGSTALGGLEWH
ncbi:hypothetical protein KSP40_PGU010607 [Platanthera guangdongensis]|uniref:Uncharacterized protein n=1 Tax=Platanthera guangdongensis TaxID=2320717 RepID=A0ABR2LV68_9ASPA